MIYNKTWSKGYGLNRVNYTAYFLFGFIPLFVSAER